MKIFTKILLTFTITSVLAFDAVAQADTSNTLVVVAGQDAALSYNQGLTDFGEGNFTQALVDFSNAVDMDPKFAKARYNLGVMELHEFISQAALEEFDAAIAINPNKAVYHLGRSIALCRLELYDEALASIRKAEKLGYSQTLLRYYYGYIYFRMGKFGDAVSQYDKAIKANSNFAHAYCDRATAHMRMKNYKAALDDYNTALQIMPNAYFVYILRADVRAAQGNYNAAIQDINYAVSMADDDDDFIFMNARGVMYGRAGKYKKAMDDFNACLEKQPQNPDTYINIGNMLMGQKKYAEAEQQYSKAIKIDGYNISAFYNRANAREFQMKLTGAKQDRKMANYLNDAQKKYVIK
ncbi:MAG: tetratricopeptide repeat protein [Bacteroidales bacterium]|nr:tetratricopeptide repeat protein [Bacteroidales bacterium]